MAIALDFPRTSLPPWPRLPKPTFTQVAVAFAQVATYADRQKTVQTLGRGRRSANSMRLRRFGGRRTRPARFRCAFAPVWWETYASSPVPVCVCAGLAGNDHRGRLSAAMCTQVVWCHPLGAASGVESERRVQILEHWKVSDIEVASVSPFTSAVAAIT
jgi:hypothetical protein